MKTRNLILGAALALGACRGQPSESQPLHLVPDMDWQPKFQAEEESRLWGDHRAMRPTVAGTIPLASTLADPKLDRDAFDRQEDQGYATGAVDGKFLNKVPIDVDADTLLRGQDRFNIYCSPCHDRTGGGRGMVVQRGYPPPVQLFSDRVRTMPDGQVFWTITNGVRNMPSYRKQIPADDRWKIVTWIRVLGRSQHAGINDVPADQRDKIDPEAK